jgi:predicted RNase H-like nuclease (RuvC/YqgF family)
MLDIEKHMESISKRFEKHENNFKNLTDKIKSFEVTQREYKKRLSRLEDRSNTDENENNKLQQVKNLYFSLFFSFFDLYQF